MRKVAIAGVAVIAAACAVVGYVAMTGGDCAGGTVYRGLDPCLASGRTAERCRSMMAQADAVLASSGPVHDTREQCEDRFVTCQRSNGATGFSPRATGVCVIPGPPETVRPVFGRG